eukprot:349893-Chlamydomonas_euryale.AAC.14
MGCTPPPPSSMQWPLQLALAAYSSCVRCSASILTWCEPVRSCSASALMQCEKCTFCPASCKQLCCSNAASGGGEGPPRHFTSAARWRSLRIEAVHICPVRASHFCHTASCACPPACTSAQSAPHTSATPPHAPAHLRARRVRTPCRSGVTMYDNPHNLFKAYNGNLTMGILPVSVFCSGHTYFTQRLWETLGLQVWLGGCGCRVAGRVGWMPEAAGVGAMWLGGLVGYLRLQVWVACGWRVGWIPRAAGVGAMWLGGCGCRVAGRVGWIAEAAGVGSGTVGLRRRGCIYALLALGSAAQLPASSATLPALPEAGHQNPIPRPCARSCTRCYARQTYAAHATQQ